MKNLVKTVVMIAGIAFVSAGSLFAQKSGVYKTFADYTSGKMEYGIDCSTEKHKIRLNEFFDKNFITVVHEGKPYNLKKAETWGFQLCDEEIVSFQDSEYYLLANNGALWIYTKQTVMAASHWEWGQMITTYFLADVEMDMEVFLN